MDMNDVIISLGNVDRITAFGSLEMSDAILQNHINYNVMMLEGFTKPTVAEVKAQKAALGL